MDTEVERRALATWLIYFHPEAVKESTTRQPAKILVTGDREWTDEKFVEKVLSMWLIPGDTLIHGNAKGADSISATVATKMGLATSAHSADWDKHGKAAGPIRNRRMLDEKPLLVLAFHDNIRKSKGTRDCIREALRRDLTVFLHSHRKDGSFGYVVLRKGDVF